MPLRMKASILQQEFAKALAVASRFVSQRAQLPILANIVLKAEKARLIMEATNLEISLSTSIGAKIEEIGEIAIPARTITDLVANLKTDQIEIKGKNEVLHIKTENFTGTIPGMNTSDFPQIQQKMSDKALVLPISEFIQSLH